MNISEQVKFVLIRSLGNFLVLFALYGVVMTFGPAILSELQFRVAQLRGVRYAIAEVPKASKTMKDTSEIELVDVVVGEKEQQLIPKDTNFSILIPKIGASTKVFPNVDPENAEEFLPVLQEGIAHAKGSVFPGFQGNTYLFAHSTDNWWNVGRYNAVFYLLKNLSAGDEVVIFFENERYDYVVSQTFIADPTDVSLLTDAQSGEELLVLQTCWPPGTTWKRLFVVAQPK